RRTEVSSSSVPSPSTPFSFTARIFLQSSQLESVEELSENDNPNYEDEGGSVRGNGTGLTDRYMEMGYMGSSALLFPPEHYLNWVKSRPPGSTRASSIHSSVHASVRSS
ncbi:hypothetical protein PENTCL1PPCAC_1274, partial [Pristionchus entomophagus]